MIASGFLALASLAVGWSEPPSGQSPVAVALQDKSENKAPEAKDKPQKKAGPKYTVGKETTYVSGPLDKEGYIDYAAALNERLRKGVTPANNANVLFWEAMGPRPEGALMPEEFFEWMGVKRPPEKGEYLIGLAKFMKEHFKHPGGERLNQIFDEMERVTSWPWTAKEYPHYAAWLKANEKPLALTVQATKREQYFSPLVTSKSDTGPGGLISALLPGVQKSRELAQLLAARAMLNVGEKRYAEAWQDLLACHRLGRLIGRGGTLIEGLVGVAIDSIAGRADLVFLDHSKLEARRIKECLRDLEQLPAMARMAEKVDLAERLMFLDISFQIQRHGLVYLNAVSGSGSKESAAEKVLGHIFLLLIDWEPARKNGNRWFDRLSAVLRIEAAEARRKQLDQIDVALKTLKANLLTPANLLNTLQEEKDVRRAAGKLFGDILLCLLVPAISKVQEAGDRTEQIQRNLHVAFALAAYKREQGRYPAKLEALEPAYLKRVPVDLFAGKELVYRPAEKGYLMYSFGANRRDDEGRGYDDDPPGGDDLVVRMPVPRPRKE